MTESPSIISSSLGENLARKRVTNYGVLTR